MTHYSHSVSRASFVSRKPEHQTPMGAAAALNAMNRPCRKPRLEDVTEKEEMYKLQRCAEEESDGSYRLLECRVRRVWRSDELALPIELLDATL